MSGILPTPFEVGKQLIDMPSPPDFVRRLNSKSLELRVYYPEFLGTTYTVQPLDLQGRPLDIYSIADVYHVLKNLYPEDSIPPTDGSVVSYNHIEMPSLNSNQLYFRVKLRGKDSCYMTLTAYADHLSVDVRYPDGSTNTPHEINIDQFAYILEALRRDYPGQTEKAA